MDSFVMNAGDSHFLGIVNVTVKNIADEPIVIGEYVHPDVVQGGEMGGNNLSSKFQKKIYLKNFKLMKKRHLI